MSLPCHIGSGWFGGPMPATTFAVMTLVIGALFLPELKNRDIFSDAKR